MNCHSLLYRTATQRLVELLFHFNPSVRFVYGGTRLGLMGVLADTALSLGIQVIGVMPPSMMSEERLHHGVNDVRIVNTLHERKETMMELAHAFVVLPGGFGTMDEVFEVLTMAHITGKHKPIAILNTEGFWDGIIQWIERAVRDGMVDKEQKNAIIVEKTPEEVVKKLIERTKHKKDMMEGSTDQRETGKL